MEPPAAISIAIHVITIGVILALWFMLLDVKDDAQAERNIRQNVEGTNISLRAEVDVLSSRVRELEEELKEVIDKSKNIIRGYNEGFTQINGIFSKFFPKEKL